MSRPRKSKGPYPPCFYAKHGAFYLVRQNKWHPLGKDLALALAEYGRIMGAPKQGRMAQAIEDYYTANAARWAKNTRLQYRQAADILKRKLAQFDPPQVKGKHVAEIKQSMAKTPNMANRVISFLRGVFSNLVEKQAVDGNPCIGIARLEEGRRDRLLTDAEWKAIHAAAPPRLQLMMEMQFLTGQRINDVIKIRRSQLTDEGVVFTQQKTGAKLLVRWSPELRDTVERAKALSGASLSLFRSSRGGSPGYRTVYDQWVKACEAAKVEDAAPNDGRAMSATATKAQGKDATALLGHATASMTKRYLRGKEIPEVDGPSFRQDLDVGQK